MKKIFLVCAFALSLPTIEVWATQLPTEISVRVNAITVTAVKPGSGHFVARKQLSVWREDGAVWYTSNGDSNPRKATTCSETINGNYYNYMTHDGYYFNYGG